MKQKITKEAFWELLNGLVDEIEEESIAEVEKELREKYEVIDDD